MGRGHRLNPYEIAWYYDPNRIKIHILPFKVIDWLIIQGFSYPITHEQEVEFKLKFL